MHCLPHQVYDLHMAQKSVMVLPSFLPLGQQSLGNGRCTYN
jgi:hypothetical protein